MKNRPVELGRDLGSGRLRVNLGRLLVRPLGKIVDMGQLLLKAVVLPLLELDHPRHVRELELLMVELVGHVGGKGRWLEGWVEVAELRLVERPRMRVVVMPLGAAGVRKPAVYTLRGARSGGLGRGP